MYSLTLTHMVRSRSQSVHAFMFFFSVLVCDACTEKESCQERSGIYGCVCLDGQRPNPEIFGK